MAFVMTSYNIIRHEGFTWLSLQKAWLIFPITYFLAFLIEWFFVGKIAMKLINKYVKALQGDPEFEYLPTFMITISNNIFKKYFNKKIVG